MWAWHSSLPPPPEPPYQNQIPENPILNSCFNQIPIYETNYFVMGSCSRKIRFQESDLLQVPFGKELGKKYVRN